jgi:hypothetical protein
MFIRDLALAAALATAGNAARLYARQGCAETETTTTTSATSTSSTATSEPTGTGEFEFLGINESGPEFGESKIPGTLNTDYVWPTLSTIDVRSDLVKNCKSVRR